MARYYVSPSDTINRAIRAGLPEGIEESGNALWAKNGAMLAVFPTRRSFRWVVTEADCMTDHEFAPSRFADALAALVSVGSLPVPATEVKEPAPVTPTAQNTGSLLDGEALLKELFGELLGVAA